VLVSIFNTRLKLLESQIATPATDVYVQTVLDLRQMMNRIPQDSFPVRKVWDDIEQAWQDGFWKLITRRKLNFCGSRSGRYCDSPPA